MLGLEINAITFVFSISESVFDNLKFVGLMLFWDELLLVYNSLFATAFLRKKLVGGGYSIFPQVSLEKL